MARYEYPSLRQGLVGAWCPSLGASGLTLIDRSGRGSHGTLVNMGGQQNWTPSGGAVSLQFDGSNDYVTMGNSPAHDVFNGNCTISIWARVPWFPPAGSAPPPLLSKGYRYVSSFNGVAIHYFEYVSVNYFQCNFGASGTQNDTNCANVSANVWYHCVWQIDGATRRAYLNGVLSDSRSHSAFVNSSTCDLMIGSQSASTPYLNGAIDDFRLYSRALTLAEIRLLASRRGIGLTPLPDRAAGLPRRFSVNVGGTWRSADAYVRTPTDWRLSDPKINVGGVWK